WRQDRGDWCCWHNERGRGNILLHILIWERAFERNGHWNTLVIHGWCVIGYGEGRGGRVNWYHWFSWCVVFVHIAVQIILRLLPFHLFHCFLCQKQYASNSYQDFSLYSLPYLSQRRKWLKP